MPDETALVRLSFDNQIYDRLIHERNKKSHTPEPGGDLFG